ncbi:MAG: amidohydrolase family protein [Saprospiraceae bacterium]
MYKPKNNVIALRVICTSWCLKLIILSSGQSYNDIRLSEYFPVSIYKIPVTQVVKAKYPVIDFHSHDYPKSDAEIDHWVKTMKECNIKKTIILSYATGKVFDSIVQKYARYPDEFDIWCGFDYTGYPEQGWINNAIAELERCHAIGASGVGELGDKGLGEFYSRPTKVSGIHIDHPDLKPLLARCGTLHMPVSIHVAEDAWMYEPADAHNDGLLNAGKWKVDISKPGILDHDALVNTLENAVKNNPNTTFIACHLANCCSNLDRLAQLFDRYPNLYSEMAARFGEIAPIPRKTKSFMEKYADRLVYGTDMGTAKHMYETTFRILESADEHFYERDLFNYHWPLHGLALSNKALKKIYSDNSRKLIR